MHKESPRPSTGYYQLEFVLVLGVRQFEGEWIVGDGGDAVGFALRGQHGGEEKISKERSEGKENGTISYIYMEP